MSDVLLQVLGALCRPQERAALILLAPSPLNQVGVTVVGKKAPVPRPALSSLGGLVLRVPGACCVLSRQGALP